MENLKFLLSTIRALKQSSWIQFSIRNDRIPKEVYRAYGYVKKATASVNFAKGLLPKWEEALIAKVSDKIKAGKLELEFPLCLVNWM